MTDSTDRGPVSLDKVTLTKDGGSVLGSEATGTISGTSVSVPLSGVPAEDVANVAVVISS